jgi:equilibrative nucleoside transporter 1/2/3
VFGVLAVTVETHIEGLVYFWFIMALIVLTGATTSFFQNSVFSEASQLPPMYMQAVLRYLFINVRILNLYVNKLK